MLKPVIDALTMYNEKGIAVITQHEENDPREIAEYVKLVLNSLKCSFDAYYNDVEHTYFIADNISEPVVAVTKCDACARPIRSDELNEYEDEFVGDMLVCDSCLEQLPTKDS